MGNLTSMEVSLDDLDFNDPTPFPDAKERQQGFARMKARGKAEFFLQSLTEIPCQVFSEFGDITSLTLSVNRIKSLCPGLFRIQTLTILNLSFNDIASLPSEIGLLTNLVSLNLKHNRLCAIPDEMNNLELLQVLNLEYNYIKRLPPLNNLKKLNEFKIQHNSLRQIEQLPGGIKNLLDMQHNRLGNTFEKVSFTEEMVKELREINLMNNRLTTLNASFKYLVNLTRLDLQNNNLSKLNDEFSLMAKLSELNLRQNNLTALPDSFCNMSCLRKVNLCSNNLSSLPENIWQLSSLTYFNLGGNYLQALPTKNFENMKVLTDIGLCNNLFKEFPEQLCTIPNLKIVNLGWNKLTEVPSQIEKISKLSWLILNGNNISDLPAEFNNLKWMKELYLGSNKFSNVPSGLSEMKGLEWVDIRNNNISTLPMGMTKLIFLEHIDAGDNASFTIPDALKAKIEKGLSIRLDSGRKNQGRWKVGMADMKGKRGGMEDAMVVDVKYRGKKGEEFFGVYDGHGGDQASQVAAKRHPKLLKEQLKRCDEKMDDDDVVDAVSESFIQTADSMNRQEVKTSGTTAVICYCLKNRIFVADIGDSRAVLFRKGKAKRISVDHKPDLKEEERRIRSLGGFVATNGRVVGKLAVSRAFGDLELKPFVSPEPFVDIIDIEEPPEFMILACDGVWDVISDEKACEIVASEIDDPLRAAMKLRDCAYAYGSLDNISVIVINCVS